MDSAKNVIRVRMKKTREDFLKSFNESGRAQLNQKLMKNLSNLIPLSITGPIAGFWPLVYEPDIRPLMEILFQQGQKILLPASLCAGSSITFRIWKPGDTLHENAFKILEPSSKSASCDPQIIIAPLLAFDGRGHRLGYGAGHYDRTLSLFQKKKLNVLTIGVAYEIQRVNELPIGAYDYPLDWVVTEDKIHKFK